MLAVAKLLVGPPMPDRPRVMTQTKRDYLVLQVGGWAWGWQPHTVKIICSETQQSASEGWETNVDERSLEVGFDKGN